LPQIVFNREDIVLKKMATSLVFGSAASMAVAQTITDIQAATPASAYLQDSRGVIARDPYGLCWRTGYWTPANAVAGCDGELVSPVPKATAPAPATTAPVVAAPPPAPAPVAAPVPPKRCDFIVTLENDQTFAFDKAALTSAAKNRIDEQVLPKLASCAKADLVIVTGHADRLGAQQYNQKLSEKRANAVAGYLKSKGVATDIDTLGVGKTQSIKACDDKLPRKELITCLAPNRRVSIEVKGLAK
jgi:OmpA-OmpF porin, OOP family